MNYNDEFESLIKNFKLDDIDNGPPLAPERKAPVPTYRQARPPAPPPSTAVPRQEAPRTSAQRQPSAPAQSRRQPPPGAQPQGSRRNNFQVNIDDKKFYTQGSGLPPRTPKSSTPPPSDGGNGDDDDDEPEGRFSGLGRWTKALLVLAVALGLAAFLASFALASASDLFGLNKPDRELTFELPEELSLSQIASLLKDKGVITQPLTFQIYAQIKYDPEDFHPGTYDLNTNMSYDQIISRFRTVKRVQEEVTIPFYEGMTLREIGERLEEKGVCDAQDFYNFLDQEEMSWRFDFLDAIPDTEHRFHRYEGYLFPDTYTFYKGEDVSTVVQKFFVNFNNKFDDELLKQIEDSGMTVDQVLTMASIIQKEVSTQEDMANVSSVFHNRLASSQIKKLQSDVTVFYVEDNIKPFLGAESGKSNPNDPNQPIYDAYNTYACDGLPAGPICNPGMDAINAALTPAETPYYFFVADKDGKTYYAATQAEHDANVAAVLQMGDAHGVGTGIGPSGENQEEASGENSAGTDASAPSGTSSP